jgi:uncharacterized membrane protein YccC
MSRGNLAAHIAGAIAILAGFTWLGFDVKPDGHVELMTAIGAAVLCSAGWFLIDKQSLVDFAAFVWAQWQKFKGGAA